MYTNVYTKSRTSRDKETKSLYSKAFVKRFRIHRNRSYLPVAIQKQLLRQSITSQEILLTINDLTPCALGLLFVLRRDCIFLDEVFYTQKYLGVLAARLLGRDKPFSERQVRRALATLKELKLIAVQSRKKQRGKYMTNIYAVADFFQLPEIKNALDKFLYHLRSMTVVSLKFLRSQSFAILRSSFGFWQNVLLNRIYVYRSLTLLTYRVTLWEIFSPKKEKESAPQRETLKSFSLGDDYELEYREREISSEEESFLAEEMRKLQYKVMAQQVSSCF
jgi:hypothetical protein